MPVVRISEELFAEVQKFAIPLVDTFETALWKALGNSERSTDHMRMSGPRRINAHVDAKEYWKPILETLVENGGSARCREVVLAVGKKMAHRLKPADYEPIKDGTPYWDRQVNWQRLELRHNGLIANGSPKGIWAITDLGRRWLTKRT